MRATILLAVAFCLFTGHAAGQTRKEWKAIVEASNKSARENGLPEAKQGVTEAKPIQAGEKTPKIQREWTSASGKTIHGTLNRVDINLSLKRSDGTIIRMSIDKLSPADQKWLLENLFPK